MGVNHVQKNNLNNSWNYLHGLFDGLRNQTRHHHRF